MAGSVGRPNVCATAHLDPSDQFLVFSGHSDPVGVASGWETDPFELTEQNGRLYGMGTVNMKGGLACSLAAFKTLVNAKALHGSLGYPGFAVTVDQEGHRTGARALLKTGYGRCDAMLHAEHFYGDSAALNRLTLREHALFGKGTVCALKIEGGYKEYSIVLPEKCEIVITHLTVPGETQEIAVQDMGDLIYALHLESNVKTETPFPCYDPYFLDEKTPLLAPSREAYRKIIGIKPHFAGHRGIVGSNVFVAEAGTPTGVFGPKGANHHAPGEYVDSATLEPVARVYTETARRFLSHHN